jgi:hypothetical protein
MKPTDLPANIYDAQERFGNEQSKLVESIDRDHYPGIQPGRLRQRLAGGFAGCFRNG